MVPTVARVAHFVQDEQLRGEIFPELVFEHAPFLGCGEIIDDIDGIGKEHGVSFHAGGVAQSCGEVGFAEANIAQEDDIGFVFDELKAEEVLDLEAVDFFGPIPAELVECFEDGKAGLLEAALDEALAAEVVLAFREPLQVAGVVPLLFRGLAGQGGMMLEEEGQLEGLKVLIEEGWFHFL
jgi:hypothetical protein